MQSHQSLNQMECIMNKCNWLIGIKEYKCRCAHEGTHTNKKKKKQTKQKCTDNIS